MRNESLPHSIMALCMGGAIVVLMVGWRWQPPTLQLMQYLQQTSHPFVKQATQQLVVKLSERKVYLYKNDRVVASYPITIGQKGWETPTGNFLIVHMEKYPSWQHPITGEVIPAGPQNPLGDRWIRFTTNKYVEIGFHGTKEEASIGQAVSHGCLRMRNEDIIKLYDQVKLGTPITVKP